MPSGIIRPAERWVGWVGNCLRLHSMRQRSGLTSRLAKGLLQASHRSSPLVSSLVSPTGLSRRGSPESWVPLAVRNAPHDRIQRFQNRVPLSGLAFLTHGMRDRVYPMSPPCLAREGAMRGRSTWPGGAHAAIVFAGKSPPPRNGRRRSGGLPPRETRPRDLTSRPRDSRNRGFGAKP